VLDLKKRDIQSYLHEALIFFFWEWSRRVGRLYDIESIDYPQLQDLQIRRNRKYKKEFHSYYRMKLYVFE
jgi:hypothetical protein